MALRIPVILGTVRDGRRSEHLARYVHSRLLARTGMESDLIDPRHHDFGNLRGRVIDLPDLDPQAPPPGVPITDELRRFIQRMHAADGFVLATPEYNYSFPGTLKNLLDVTHKPWNRKPFGLVACGGVSGGMRAVDALRQVVSGLGAVCVPAHVTVQSIGKAFGPEGPLADAEAWRKRIDSFLDEVLWYAEALKAARAGPVQA
ncbi:MAG TPA: NAD(P)H-dependent oxidoreductase [Candidatus Thermoplasmatota archaeon]|nr:NAD(P)H-dependent oxidoreductase [Candidatus Thermoplasmatota archaeon]